MTTRVAGFGVLPQLENRLRRRSFEPASQVRVSMATGSQTPPKRYLSLYLLLSSRAWCSTLFGERYLSGILGKLRKVFPTYISVSQFRPITAVLQVEFRVVATGLEIPVRPHLEERAPHGVLTVNRKLVSG